MKENLKVTTEKDDGILTTLVIEYSLENSSILCGMNITIHDVTRQFSINPSNIYSIKITKKGLNRKIKIKYSKFDFYAITLLESKEQQIVEILNLLGYPENKIAGITCKKKYPTVDYSTEMIWVTMIYKDNENISQSSHETSLSRKISNALGFEVKVKFQ